MLIIRLRLYGKHTKAHLGYPRQGFGQGVGGSQPIF